MLPHTLEPLSGNNISELVSGDCCGRCDALIENLLFTRNAVGSIEGSPEIAPHYPMPVNLPTDIFGGAS